jgi:uncharacterized protein (DUF4415 family)
MNPGRPVQFFSKEYLKQCARMKPEQIVAFLEQFCLLHGGGKPSRSRLISLKVEETLLEAFRSRCVLQGTPYQTQIKRIMREWLKT